MKFLKLVALFSFIFTLPISLDAGGTEVFDLAEDWSDAENPFNQWTLIGCRFDPNAACVDPQFFEPLAVQSPNLFRFDFGCTQPGWSEGGIMCDQNPPADSCPDDPPPSGCEPNFFRSTESHLGCCRRPSAGSLDMPLGTVATHGPTGVIWTADEPGNVVISGGVWLPRHINRSQTVAIEYNGITISSVALISGDKSFKASCTFPTVPLKS